jgi:5-methylcytosine-specific restriction protein A
MANAWLMLAYGDERLYGGNAGYEDKPADTYEFDSFVAYHKQVKQGDVVVLCHKDSVAGVGLVDSLTDEPHERVIRRCPVCGTAQSKRRKNRLPEFRCNKGHEFDLPVEERVECRKFVAKYGANFTPTTNLSIETARKACPRFNGQNSIQPLDVQQLRGYLNAASPELLQAIGTVRPPSADKIPDGLTRADILWAIDQLRQNVDHPFGGSTDYDVLFESGRFPPKAVVGIAACRILGHQLTPRDFSAGITSKCFRVLTENGFDIVTKGTVAPFPDELPVDQTFQEGTARQVLVNRFERDSRARAECIRRCGKVCKVCRFDFAAVFGTLGEGFIHVHHVVPISEIGDAYSLNPATDLVPVCPNCHAMLHKRNPPYSVAELVTIIAQHLGKRD